MSVPSETRLDVMHINPRGTVDHVGRIPTPGNHWGKTRKSSGRGVNPRAAKKRNRKAKSQRERDTAVDLSRGVGAQREGERDSDYRLRLSVAMKQRGY